MNQPKTMKSELATKPRKCEDEKDGVEV